MGSIVKMNDVVVRPRDMEQVAEWMHSALKGRAFSVLSKESQFADEPFLLDDCTLNENCLNPVFVSPKKMQFLFCIEGPDDLLVPYGGLGKLLITFNRTGFKIENAGVGTWEFKVKPHKQV